MTNQVQQKKMDMEHPTLGSYMQIQSSESTTLFSGKKNQSYQGLHFSFSNQYHIYLK
jgi:hypothetical protein